MEAVANTTTRSPRAEIKEEIISVAVLKVAEAIAEAPRAVVDNRGIITRDLRPQTPSNKSRLSNSQILNKRSTRALLPRKIIREVVKAVRISSDHRQLRPNRLLQDNKSLRRKKRARRSWMEAGVL